MNAVEQRLEHVSIRDNDVLSSDSDDVSEDPHHLENLLRQWFEKNLALGKCYGSRSQGDGAARPFTPAPLEASTGTARLVYQDGTACSASHAFSDVFLLSTGEYLVQTDCGVAQCRGDDSHSNAECIVAGPFRHLWQVFDELCFFSFHDRNTCGDMMLHTLCRGDRNLYRRASGVLPFRYDPAAMQRLLNIVQHHVAATTDE